MQRPWKLVKYHYICIIPTNFAPRHKQDRFQSVYSHLFTISISQPAPTWIIPAISLPTRIPSTNTRLIATLPPRAPRPPYSMQISRPAAVLQRRGISRAIYGTRLPIRESHGRGTRSSGAELCPFPLTNGSKLPIICNHLKVCTRSSREPGQPKRVNLRPRAFFHSGIDAVACLDS